MIIVTGGAGFIGSCMVSKLNQMGHDRILVTDHLGTSDKWKNLRHLKFYDYLDRDQLFDFLGHHNQVQAIIHMGACSATTERDANYLMENNYRYTKRLAEYCLARDARFIYASSAATYGDGNKGYSDDESGIDRFEPMNMYGYSKHLFDLKARAEGWFQNTVGLKFFNVYGPNEYFKGDMVSVVYKSFNQIKADGKVKLFKSHRANFEDGGQQRDFVYVKDVVNVMAWLLENPQVNGLFNLGTGQARNFRDLVSAAFHALHLEPNIEYIDMPEHLRDRYQYFTQADMQKLVDAGYNQPFHNLEDGVTDYVQNYLDQNFKAY
ncbi:ADP-glyceromanno-heptose 6-epimerase [Acanthopleuribacter pedis]|uniref:ADP-L-glycero-D-manno-heptose-6-epimerase n=1 Tax=Acanthopleuribacter pedis TaxID=442870 RepID=A0A8J7QAV8_9BACT|nr:ADP-glyceromanno-heptose 6-epimerase [Acanthopleuribacter pedis]MBO1322111.1 ADP-glyceromanno-heptose 6-epimerase [Acanthopleuribacter pedis]